MPAVANSIAALFLIWGACLPGLAGPARADQAPVLPGPLVAEVIRVVDGDTVDVRATIWIGQSIETRVRLADVDAPEVHGRCVIERRLGDVARTELTARLSGARVILTDVRQGTFAGRVIARVSDATGQDIGQWLIARRLARAYGWKRRCQSCTRIETCDAWARWAGANRPLDRPDLRPRLVHAPAQLR